MRSDRAFVVALVAAAALLGGAAKPAPLPTPSAEPTARPVADETLRGPAFLAPSPPPVRTPEPADAVVAAIGYAVIARSAYEAYRQAFEPHEPPAVALQKLIDDRLLAAEARRYAIAPGPGELQAARAKHPAPASFAPSEWDAMLLDRALARRFLDFRFGDFVPVTREEIRALIKAHPKSFTGSTEANEAKARALLLPAARAKREDAFREELRTRALVRVMPEALPRE